MNWNEAKRVLRYLKGTVTKKLALSKTDNNDKFLHGYAVVDYGECRTDRKSNSGYVFFVNSGLISLEETTNGSAIVNQSRICGL